MTDALVSELREDAKTLVADYGIQNDGSVDRAIIDYGESLNKAADAIEHLQAEVERLTRERDKARDDYSRRHEDVCAQLNLRIEAEAERDAARRELAECRNKTLDEAIGACCPHQDDDVMDRQAKHEVARKIIALKTEA